MQPQKLIIDTDPGVDDAMAIIYAHLAEDIELMGLTTIFGNVTRDIATRNALTLVEMLDSTAAVAAGAPTPLQQDAREVAWEVHGREGFGDIPPGSPQRNADPRPAYQFIIDTIHQHPGEVTLCPIGPLTNIALALQHDPSIVAAVKAVVVMGGSLDEGGNVTPHAEANIWQDPHAAEQVFSANWPVTMMGLDVTHRVICTPEEFATLPAAAPVYGGFLNQAAQFYFDFHQRVDGLHGCHMHDPTAVIAVLHPEWVETTALPLDVVLEGEQVGRTQRSSKPNKTSVNVATRIQAEAVKKHFLQTIQGGL